MLWLELHEVGENVDGHRKDYSAVMLGCDTIKSLEISQLKLIFCKLRGEVM